jgi:ethanolamine utilization protein EutN
VKIAIIRGHLTATVKHPSLARTRLLIAQPVDAEDKPEGCPQVVLDPLGAGIHQKVMLCSDGKYAAEYLKDPKSPARWWIQGIIDPERSLAL